jgi:hypothetical protein
VVQEKEALVLYRLVLQLLLDEADAVLEIVTDGGWSFCFIRKGVKDIPPRSSDKRNTPAWILMRVALSACSMLGREVPSKHATLRPDCCDPFDACNQLNQLMELSQILAHPRLAEGRIQMPSNLRCAIPALADRSVRRFIDYQPRCVSHKHCFS